MTPPRIPPAAAGRPCSPDPTAAPASEEPASPQRAATTADARFAGLSPARARSPAGAAAAAPRPPRGASPPTAARPITGLPVELVRAIAAHQMPALEPGELRRRLHSLDSAAHASAEGAVVRQRFPGNEVFMFQARRWEERLDATAASSLSPEQAEQWRDMRAFAGTSRGLQASLADEHGIAALMAGITRIGGVSSLATFRETLAHVQALPPEVSPFLQATSRAVSDAINDEEFRRAEAAEFPGSSPRSFGLASLARSIGRLPEGDRWEAFQQIADAVEDLPPATRANVLRAQAHAAPTLQPSEALAAWTWLQETAQALPLALQGETMPALTKAAALLAPFDPAAEPDIARQAREVFDAMHARYPAANARERADLAWGMLRTLQSTTELFVPGTLRSEGAARLMDAFETRAPAGAASILRGIWHHSTWTDDAPARATLQRRVCQALVTAASDAASSREVALDILQSPRDFAAFDIAIKELQPLLGDDGVLEGIGALLTEQRSSDLHITLAHVRKSLTDAPLPMKLRTLGLILSQAGRLVDGSEATSDESMSTSDDGMASVASSDDSEATTTPGEQAAEEEFLANLAWLRAQVTRPGTPGIVLDPAHAQAFEDALAQAATTVADAALPPSMTDFLLEGLALLRDAPRA